MGKNDVGSEALLCFLLFLLAHLILVFVHDSMLHSLNIITYQSLPKKVCIFCNIAKA